MTRHVPVLLKETVDLLDLQSGDTAVDATLGGGGHAREMLARILPDGRLLALDTDARAIEMFRERAAGDAMFSEALRTGRMTVLHRNFSELTEALSESGMDKTDAVVADLGFSSDQIEDARRGLSFLRPGPLDMRLDPREVLTAEQLVNTCDASELTRIFREYGDERFAGAIARSIVRTRTAEPIQTTTALAEIVVKAVPARACRPGIHPATKVFQALRIVVNREFERLDAFLLQAVASLRPGGRLAVITFHSGEDRAVKRFIRSQEQGCVCPAGLPVCRCGRVPVLRRVTRRPATPTEREREENPRARSAKLRVAERI